MLFLYRLLAAVHRCVFSNFNFYSVSSFLVIHRLLSIGLIFRSWYLSYNHLQQISIFPPLKNISAICDIDLVVMDHELICVLHIFAPQVSQAFPKWESRMETRVCGFP